ncbi:DUF4352 domain-containing protein [Ornithinimicrobium panacihumi]|uniref:DUF4352 domain-containing protein n=1 Tax=Ornithinimicrobium panacihumi TaxID=2008449 RepID=UPI003F8C4B45
MSTYDQTPTPQPAAPPPPAPAKKSWFRRHKILTGILGLFLVLVLANMFGDDTQDTAPAAADKTSSETAHASDGEGAGPSASSQGSTADGSAADDEASAKADQEAADKAAAEKEAAEKEAAEKEAAEKKAAEEAAAAPTIGDTVTIGDFEVTVSGIEDGFDYVGPADWGEAAQGQFVKILLTVKNNGTSAEYFLDSEQKLIDEQDREHSTSSAAYLLDEENLWLTEINPGNTATGALLYDIPTDATPVRIHLSSGWFGDTAEVSLEQ